MTDWIRPDLQYVMAEAWEWAVEQPLEQKQPIQRKACARALQKYERPARQRAYASVALIAWASRN